MVNSEAPDMVEILSNMVHALHSSPRAEAAWESLGVLEALYDDGDIPASVRPIVRAILVKAGRDPEAQ